MFRRNRNIFNQLGITFTPTFRLIYHRALFSKISGSRLFNRQETKKTTTESIEQNYTRAVLAEIEKLFGNFIRGKEWNSIISKEDAYQIIESIWKNYTSKNGTNLTEVTSHKSSRDQYFQNSSSTFFSLMEKYNVLNKMKDIASDLLDLVPQSVMHDDIKLALRDVSKLSESFIKSLVELNITFQHPFLVNLGLIRLYDRKLHLSGGDLRLIHTMPGVLSDRTRAKTLHFLQIASGMYDNAIPVSKGDILLNNLRQSSTLIPAHVVFLDHLTESIVVAITGTRSIHDLFIDLRLDTRPFNNLTLEDGSVVQAHRGMADSAEALLPSIRECIQGAMKLKEGKFNNYKIVLTGHSLGAGTACLLSMLLEQTLKQNISVYAFACPPLITKYSDEVQPESKSMLQSLLFRRTSATKTQSKVEILNFIHNHDIISRISRYEVLNLISMVKAVDNLEWSATQRASMILRDSLTSKEVISIQNALSSKISFLNIQNEFKLLVPGTLFWLKPRWKSDGSVYDLLHLKDSDSITSGSYFPEDSIVSDHFLRQYLDAFVHCECT